jgi:hypothetical protein
MTIWIKVNSIGVPLLCDFGTAPKRTFADQRLENEICLNLYKKVIDERLQLGNAPVYCLAPTYKAYHKVG